MMFLILSWKNIILLDIVKSIYPFIVNINIAKRK